MRAAVVLLMLFAAQSAVAQAGVAATVEGRATLVLKRALKAEPLAGFSSVSVRPDATYWVMADTGHAAQARRKDVELVFHHIVLDWQRGTAKLLSTQPLSDPHRRIPFPIVNERSAERLLTGADFNIDAMRFVGYNAWLADDSGPYLIEADLAGHVLALFEIMVEGRALRAAEMRQRLGGLAASPDERFLYAAFEGPLWDAGTAAWETTAEGRDYARIVEFDLGRGAWTGRSIAYPLEARGNTIGDLGMIDERTALVLERGEGFRRVYKVRLESGRATKLAFVDLASIRLQTAEGLDVIDPRYFVVSDAARSEVILLRAPELMAAP